MTIIRVESFGGIVPKLKATMLPENAAVDCVNYELTRRGLVPLYAQQDKYQLASSLTFLAATTIQQMPTACCFVQGSGGTYAQFAPIGGNYVVVANDVLQYAVFLPAGSALAGQGCIDIHCTSGATLGNVNDQNAIGSLTGNIVANAQGKWYFRSISLASIVGLTIDGVRFYLNHAGANLSAYFSYAVVKNTAGNVLKKVLWDADQQATTSALTSQIASQTLLDEDESVLVSCVYQDTIIDKDNMHYVIPAQFSGVPKNKWIVVARLGQGSFASAYGLSNYGIPDSWFVSGGGSSISLGNKAFNFVVDGITSTAGRGWTAIPKPTAAMALAVVGGTGPVVTRSYVYTRVSEDGLESAPSPPITTTGNRDGTWQLTSITSWAGTDNFNGVRNPAKKRIYRTPESSATYKLVAEISATTVSANDTALDTALGESLATSLYLDFPPLTAIAPFTKGMVGGVVEETTVAFCEPYRYHAWPLSYRYSIPYVAVSMKPLGDRMAVLTKGKPVLFSGTSPDVMQWAEIDQGEPCIGAKGAISSPAGVIYPGSTGWCLINYGGFQKITAEFLAEDDYASVVSKDTISMFDGRRLHWCTQGAEQFATHGYSFEFGANERALTKFELDVSIFAMSYYEPRATRWLAYAKTTNGQLFAGKLFADSTRRLRGIWKSKLFKTPKKCRLGVAQVKSEEWDSLSVEMKNREVFYRERQTAWVTATAYAVNDMVTQGGHQYRCLIAHTSGTFAVDLAALKWILNETPYAMSPQWVTATSYAQNDTVVFGTSRYLCLSAHVSGVFATDLAALKWILTDFKTVYGLVQSEKWCYLKVWAEADKGNDAVLVYDDFVVSDRPVRLARSIKSDCWQFEVRGNIHVARVAMAELEKELNQE